MNRARAEALRQLVERRQMTLGLMRDGAYVTAAEIDKELDKYRAQAKARSMSLERFLNRGQLTVDALRYDVAWKLGSQKYVEQHLVDWTQPVQGQVHRLVPGGGGGTHSIVVSIPLDPTTPAAPIEQGELG